MWRLSFLFILFSSNLVTATNSIPTVPKLDKSSTVVLMSKVKRNLAKTQKKGTKHDAYQVIDKDGNVSYVDSLKKPKNQIIINDFSGLSPINRKRIRTDVYIGEICMNVKCR